jgi:type IV pilus assembly protein PilQ
VDKTVPVNLIEVVSVDNKASRSLSTGLSAGIAEEPVTSSGTIAPSVDMTIGAGDINKILDGLNGHGWVNLGKVNPNFYMTLQALEENGVIEVRSTPQLSTMNGHKATMSIGRTEYYKEELNVMYGTVTSSSQKTTTYKPVEAELKLDIRPLVAGNQEVTLNVSVEQSDFTERIEKNAPPGKVTRKFESLIRVKDQEMILLGGLEEASRRNTTSGVPLLARIPIIKWLFSSRSKSKSESKLNIFIKPTIIS